MAFFKAFATFSLCRKKEKIKHKLLNNFANIALKRLYQIILLAVGWHYLSSIF